MISRWSVLAFFVFISECLSTDSCNQILADGIFNTAHVSSSSDFKRDSLRVWCNTQTANKAHELGVSFPIENIPIGVKGSSRSATYSQLCENFHEYLSVSSTSDILLRYASDAIVDAWLACMKSEPLVVYGRRASPTSSLVSLHVEWKPTDGGSLHLALNIENAKMATSAPLTIPQGNSIFALRILDTEKDSKIVLSGTSGCVAHAVEYVLPALSQKPLPNIPKPFDLSIYGILSAAGWRTKSELRWMSEEDRRNTLIVELNKNSLSSISHYQSFQTDRLIGKGGLYLVLKQLHFRTQGELFGMSDDDWRNTLIVELNKADRGTISYLQGLSDGQLVKSAFSFY